MLVNKASAKASGQTSRDSTGQIAPGGSRRTWLSRFRRDESGVLVIFSLFFLLIIFAVGGIGVDLMRFEMNRTRVQNVLDRAVLAAADLDQKLEPAAVVRDYFRKAGMKGALTSITVDSGLNYRVVSATAENTMETQFIKMLGINYLKAPAAGTAEERIDEVEISLVLDVSGSMRWNDRIKNMKVAAKDFVAQVIENNELGKVSISIIPYSTQVSPSAKLAAQYNLSKEHTTSGCIDFKDADFSNPGLSTIEPLERVAHFDRWSGRAERISAQDIANGQELPRPVCATSSDLMIVPLRKGVPQLQSYIQNLQATDNTSIDIGMKWASILLDPGTRPVVTNLIAENEVPAVFAGRPRSYSEKGVLKVVVLMTDGQNTSQYDLKAPYKSGPSSVFYNAAEDEYSVFDPTRSAPDQYYWPRDYGWHDHAYGNGSYEKCWRNSRRDPWTCDMIFEPGNGTVKELSYPELFRQVSLSYADRVLFAYKSWSANNIQDSIGNSTKNARLKKICDATKANDVIVFTIGFEAPDDGKRVLLDCASSVSHFYDVQGAEIVDAFSAIASSIRKLKLTQ